jgi:hypothetical protein
MPSETYDVQRDDEDETRYAGRSYDLDEPDRMCGINEPWYDLDPDGVMWS